MWHETRFTIEGHRSAFGRCREKRPCAWRLLTSHLRILRNLSRHQIRSGGDARGPTRPQRRPPADRWPHRRCTCRISRLESRSIFSTPLLLTYPRLIQRARPYFGFRGSGGIDVVDDHYKHETQKGGYTDVLGRRATRAVVLAKKRRPHSD